LSTLRGISVLITRPAHQSARFRRLLLGAGAQVRELPSISIEFGAEQGGDYCYIPETAYIFTSANAVTACSQVCRQWPFPKDAEIFAIGPTTAAALRSHGLEPTIPAASASDSETLLQLLPASYPPGKQFIIVRGNSGRELLYQTLQQRGAQVSYWQVYQRKMPNYPAATVGLATENLDVISVSSDEGLQNLIAMLPTDVADCVFSRKLVVNSQRCADLARTIGFRETIVVASPAGDFGQLQALLKSR